MCGIVFRPGPSFQIQNAGWDVGGLDAITACREVVFSKMHLGLDDGKLVVEVA
jgi:hypothetical protein